MDLEGFAKRGLKRNDDAIESKLIALIREVKEIPESRAKTLAQAVLEEAKATLHPRGDVFRLEEVGVSMGDYGVGSRGSGDFYTHTKIAEVIGRTDAVVDSRQLDPIFSLQATRATSALYSVAYMERSAAKGRPSGVA